MEHVRETHPSALLNPLSVYNRANQRTTGYKKFSVFFFKAEVAFRSKEEVDRELGRAIG